MREEPLRVQAALRQEAQEREPLAMTIASMESALRGRTARLVLLGALIGTGGLTAHKTGALEMAFGRSADPRVEVLEKRSANTERLVRWLVRQEIRRQAREGGAIAEPPEDVE